MLGFIFLIFAFVFLLLGLGSYKKRRQQQAAYYKQNNPQAYNGYSGYNNNQSPYGVQSPHQPPPPMYNNAPGPMEAGLIQAPPPVYTPYAGPGVGRKSELGGPAANPKSGFRGWIRGG